MLNVTRKVVNQLALCQEKYSAKKSTNMKGSYMFELSSSSFKLVASYKFTTGCKHRFLNLNLITRTEIMQTVTVKVKSVLCNFKAPKHV